MKTKTRTLKHAPRAPATIGGVEAERRHKYTHSNTPEREWRGAAETRNQANTYTAHTRARTCGVQV